MTFSTEYLFEYSQSLEKHIFKNNNHSVIFDYGGPNIGKDLHVGHIRTSEYWSIFIIFLNWLEIK